jgi:Ser-tRNA(Ala) deacylase AlaX
MTADRWCNRVNASVLSNEACRLILERVKGKLGFEKALKALRGAPCTGTHVKNTGEAGKIRMLRLEKHLRGFKLTYNVE